MTFNKKMLTYVVIAISAVSIVSIFIHNSENTSIEHISIGYLANVDGLATMIALDQGYFQQEGLNVTAQQFQTSNQLGEAVERGDIDFGAVTASDVVFNIEEQAPSSMKIIAAMIHSSDSPFTNLLIGNDSTLSVKDLSGKSIGLFPGQSSGDMTRLALRNLVGSNFNATYVQIPPNLWGSALASKRIDVLVAYEPYGTQLEQAGVGKLLFAGLWEKKVMDDEPVAVSIVSSNVANNPSKVEKIEKALTMARNYINSNETNARIIATKFIPVDKSVALKMNLVGLQIGNEIDIFSLQKYADILYAGGAIPAKINATEITLGFGCCR